MIVTAMVLWIGVTLGLWAILMDPACGGAACDQMRAEAAVIRASLLVAWVVGIVVGGVTLILLWRRTGSA